MNKADTIKEDGQGSFSYFSRLSFPFGNKPDEIYFTYK
jgi:hypothetical protein